MRRFLILLAFFLTPATPSLLHAGCGLELCSHERNEPSASSWLARAEFDVTGFDVSGFSGHYTRTRLGARRYFENWTLGLDLPIIILDATGKSSTGLGNPVVSVERGLGRIGGSDFVLGLQIEIPTGDDKNGLAADHLEWLPFATVMRDLGPLHGFLSIGARLSGGDDHGHGAASTFPVLVEPHTDKELLARSGLSGALGSSAWRWHGAIGFQLPIEDPDKGKGFLQIGGRLSRAFGDFKIGPYLQGHLTKPRRHDWRAGFRIERSL